MSQKSRKVALGEMIARKQLEWEELDRAYKSLGDKLDRAKKRREEINGIEREILDDYAHDLMQAMEDLQPKIYGLEDWLIDHAAPGWALKSKQP